KDSAVAKSSLTEYVRVWTSEGKQNILRTVPEAWHQGYEELVHAGLVPDGKDPSKWFTNELIPA
ncbi:MAG TPA: nitrate ABC transporter substrate-binding protein, partial [Gammaproteobacteria bacterium]|nr:nitrate ABC transporter substrate-binding protein [Gammaproteobacteria bacterium]